MTELYGKCRELGYCDCGGFHGCVDEDIQERPEGVESNRIDRLLRESLVKEGRDQADAEAKSNCGYCRRKGSACAKHGGGPSYKMPKDHTQRQYRNCGDCGQPIRGRHKCKAPSERNPLASLPTPQNLICGCKMLGEKKVYWCVNHTEKPTSNPLPEPKSKPGKLLVHSNALGSEGFSTSQCTTVEITIGDIEIRIRVGGKDV